MVDKLPGRVRVLSHYTRSRIQQSPNILFVFGDNMARMGYGGQAREARGEPNSVGIPTKMSPSQYLTDEDFYTVKEPIVAAFVRLAQHLRSGNDIVWPRDGVGTGLARLPETAPAIFCAIEDCKQALFLMADAIIVET